MQQSQPIRKGSALAASMDQLSEASKRVLAAAESVTPGATNSTDSGSPSQRSPMTAPWGTLWLLLIWLVAHALAYFVLSALLRDLEIRKIYEAWLAVLALVAIPLTCAVAIAYVNARRHLRAGEPAHWLISSGMVESLGVLIIQLRLTIPMIAAPFDVIIPTWMGISSSWTVLTLILWINLVRWQAISRARLPSTDAVAVLVEEAPHDAGGAAPEDSSRPA